MSISDINEHIIRCSDAQYSFEKVPKEGGNNNRKKLKLDTKGNVIMKVRELDTDRAKSLEFLKGSEMKDTFEYLLLKHLDP